MNQQKNFVKALILLSAILIMLIYTINNFGWLELPRILYGVVVGLGIITFFSYKHMSKVSAKMFVNSFMGIMGIKMFASLIFLVIYLFIDSSQKYEVAFGLFTIYIIYNVFLFSNINEIKPKNNAI